MKIRPLLILSFLLLPVLGLQAQNEDIPKLSGDKLVYDMGDLMSSGEEAQLEQKLVAYSDSTSNQFVIVTVPNLNGYDVGDFAQRLGQKNGIGTAKDNGAVMVIAKEEKQMSIQVGYGLEPVITDGQAGFIIRNILRPNFRNNDFYKGIDEATTAMMEMAAGEFKAENYKKDGGGKVWGFVVFGIIFIIFSIIGRLSRRNRYQNYSGNGRSSGAPWIFWGGGTGGGGFGGGGSSGGGFGGFGGGGFGGGGASGGW